MQGLITLILLGAFSLLYVSKSITQKPEFVTKALKFISDNIDMLALVGLIYGIIAAMLTPLTALSTTEMLIRFLANLMLVVLALPYTFERLATKYADKMNEAFVSEFRAFTGRIMSNEKIFGIAGAVIALFLFAVLFR